uniref:Tudor domain-containing protein n=1 Tax=Macrostomum lignano TaxID=282301 RepID=A0A1I8GFU3_9PLAT
MKREELEEELERQLQRERKRYEERERQRRQKREEERERQRQLQLQGQRDAERSAKQAEAVESIVELVRVAAERLSMPLRPAHLAQSFEIFYKQPFPLDLFDRSSAEEVAVNLALSGRLVLDSKRCLRVASNAMVESAKCSASASKRQLSLPAEVKKRLLCIAYVYPGLPVLLLPEKYREEFKCDLPSFSSMGCNNLLDLLRQIPGIVLMKNPIDPDLRIAVYGTRLPNLPKAPPFPENCVPPGYRLPVERMRRPRQPAVGTEVSAHYLLQQQYNVLVPLASNSGPGRFFVIPHGEVSNRLDKLMEQLDSAEHPPMPEVYTRPDQLCVAVTKQGCRRVRIVSHAADGSADRRLVEDVDYGELLTVGVSDLRCMHRRFAEGVPAHAILCRLAFLIPNGGAAQFDEAAVKEFHRITQDVLLKLTVDLEPPADQPHAPYSVYLDGEMGSFLEFFSRQSLGLLPIQIDFKQKAFAPLGKVDRLCKPDGKKAAQCEPEASVRTGGHSDIEEVGTDAEAGSSRAMTPGSEAGDGLDENLQEYDHNQDYEQQDYERQDYEQQDYERQDYEQQDYERQDYEQQDYERQDYEQQDYERQADDEPQADDGQEADDEQRQNYEWQNYECQDYEQQDYKRQNYEQQDYERQDYEQQDYERQDYEQQEDYEQSGRVADEQPKHTDGAAVCQIVGSGGLSGRVSRCAVPLTKSRLSIRQRVSLAAGALAGVRADLASVRQPACSGLLSSARARLTRCSVQLQLFCLEEEPEQGSDASSSSSSESDLPSQTQQNSTVLSPEAVPFFSPLRRPLAPPRFRALLAGQQQSATTPQQQPPLSSGAVSTLPQLPTLPPGQLMGGWGRFK